MKSSAKNIRLASVDDLFTTETDREENQKEKIEELSVHDLIPFRNHPFQVLDDDKMEETVESIRKYGVLVPILVRPAENGLYEIISGHRRTHASQLAGFHTIPAMIRNLDDDEATIIMVDSNLQREVILPSERAYAYQMKVQAIRRKAGRPSKNLSHVGTNKRTDTIVAEEAGESRAQVQRYLRLTHLIPKLLELTDQKRLNLNSAVEISYLTEKEQEFVLHTIETEGFTPSVAQAQEMHRCSKNHELTEDRVLSLMMKREDDIRASGLKTDEIPVSAERLSRYFPNQKPEQMVEKMFYVLEQWHRKVQEKKRQTPER